MQQTRKKGGAGAGERTMAEKHCLRARKPQRFALEALKSFLATSFQLVDSSTPPARQKGHVGWKWRTGELAGRLMTPPSTCR